MVSLQHTTCNRRTLTEQQVRISHLAMLLRLPLLLLLRLPLLLLLRLLLLPLTWAS
jgi:hypothetical protein